MIPPTNPSNNANPAGGYGGASNVAWAENPGVDASFGVVKAAGGTLWGFSGLLKSGSGPVDPSLQIDDGHFLLFFDAPSLAGITLMGLLTGNPPTTSQAAQAPLFAAMEIQPRVPFTRSFSRGLKFATGLVWCVSNSSAMLSLDAASLCLIDVEFA